MQLAGYGLRRIYLRRTSVHNESTSTKFRVDVAGAIIVHSPSSFLEARERRRSPQSRLSSRALFRRSRTYTPPAPIHHPLVFSKKLSRIPKEDPPEEGRMEGLHVSVRLALEDRHA